MGQVKVTSGDANPLGMHHTVHILGERIKSKIPPFDDLSSSLSDLPSTLSLPSTLRSHFVPSALSARQDRRAGPKSRTKCRIEDQRRDQCKTGPKGRTKCGVEDRVVSPSTSFRINKAEPKGWLTNKDLSSRLRHA